MYRRHLYLPTAVMISQQSSQNSDLEHQRLQHKLQYLPRNRFCPLATLRLQCNLDIHHSLKFHLPQLICKSTLKCLTTSLNQRQIMSRLISLLVPQLLSATLLVERHLYLSHSKRLHSMKFCKLQILPISHTLSELMN